ncbi:MAG: ATP-binding cassette domain-containing protein, partial [Rhodobacteraceae bacterium]|nr:ATP-binding cassette domain-containing protein [Paracoccaceae bacterium]
TLRDNVGLGHMDLDDDRLITALRLTGLGDDPSQARLMSLDMPVAEQGANLSGGQRQAINIARALAPDPDILLMDEPSSAMDAQLEAHLVRQIKSDLADKTFVIVTHKAKILDLCDRVVVVDRGRIVGDMPARDYFAAREARTQRVQAGGAS